jgi:Flp pilus assembly protein TadD
LRWDPKNLALLDRLLTVAGIHQNSQASARQAAASFGMIGAGSPREVLTLWVASQEVESEAGAKKIREMLVRSPTAQLHFSYGIYEHRRGNLKEARFHWEMAQKMNPEVPDVANNLAWLLLQTSPDELPKALDLIEMALERRPDDFNFHDTRGLIRLKMGEQKAERGDAKGAEKNFVDAVRDLEYALRGSPMKANVHLALANAYRRLGNSAVADEHVLAAEQEKTPKTKTGPR